MISELFSGFGAKRDQIVKLGGCHANDGIARAVVDADGIVILEN